MMVVTNLPALLVSQGAPSLFSHVAFLGQIGYLVEILLAAATVVLGAIGTLRFFDRNRRHPGRARIEEHCDPSNARRQARDEDLPERDVEVTIRLEEVFFPIPHRHQCIVTIHLPSGGVQDTGREAWYARDDA